MKPLSDAELTAIAANADDVLGLVRGMASALTHEYSVGGDTAVEDAEIAEAVAHVDAVHRVIAEYRRLRAFQEACGKTGAQIVTIGEGVNQKTIALVPA